MDKGKWRVGVQRGKGARRSERVFMGDFLVLPAIMVVNTCGPVFACVLYMGWLHTPW